MPGPPRGRFIVLEGIDGSGKTTQAERLASDLGALLTHEPGGTVLGQALRRLLLYDEHSIPSPRAEALLMAADRAQHVEEVLLPALRSGRWVVSERYSPSTLTYQGWGRGLQTDELRVVCDWAAAGLEPDLCILVDVEVDVAKSRLVAERGDRFERLGLGFHRRVREGYLALAAADPGRWLIVDGSQPPDSLAAQVVAAVRMRLGWPEGHL